MKEHLKNAAGKAKTRIKNAEKHDFMYLFKKYNFIVLFGCTFTMYFVIFSIQNVLGGKNGKSVEDQMVPSYNSEISQTTQAVNNNTNGIQIQDGQQQMTDQNGLVIVTNTQSDVPQPQFCKADVSYLDGALFIGDSRTMALQSFAGLENTNFFVDTGMNIWKVLDAEIATVNGVKMSVESALQSAKFDKIYIMLGINELGTGTAETFVQQYKYVVDRIMQMQPQAIIYLQSIMHVTQEKDDAGTIINNNEINNRNTRLKGLADNIHVFWLDENEILDSPETGKLNPEYTSDGVHLKAKYISVWKDYILSHTIAY